MDVRMLALGIERVGMESSRARRTRSEWVVALHCLVSSMQGWSGRNIPKWITYDEEGDIYLVGILKDIVAR
jgi:hypothetical protein